MSRYFYAYQYDMPFKPTYLKNWEVPKFNCTKPKKRTGSTTIISNPRGHLLPGILRCANPFGTYAGTWELPKKLTKETAFKINGLTYKGRNLTDCVVQVASKLNGNEKEEDEVKEISKVEEDLGRPVNEKLKKNSKTLCPIHNV